MLSLVVDRSSGGPLYTRPRGLLADACQPRATTRERPSDGSSTSGARGTLTGAGSDQLDLLSVLGGSRTPNLLIRSQMLYPLSYERSWCDQRV